MPILLFLSAMLAGLTGLISGDRIAEPRHVEQAVAMAASVAEAAPAARKAEAAIVADIPASIPFAGGRTFASSVQPAPRSLPPVNERRLE